MSKKFSDIERNDINAKWFDEIEKLEEKLNEDLTKREKKKIEKEITKNKKYIEKSAFWQNLADKAETTGNKLQNVGGKMQKVGLKTTAAVWTLALYGAYKVGKSLKNKPKEDDLIKFIKECQTAYKDGKITENEMKEHILTFTNNYYK